MTDLNQPVAAPPPSGGPDQPSAPSPRRRTRGGVVIVGALAIAALAGGLWLQSRPKPTNDATIDTFIAIVDDVEAAIKDGSFVWPETVEAAFPYPTTRTDQWGTPIDAQVRQNDQTALLLRVRSAGPDRKMRTDDDIAETRFVRAKRPAAAE